MVRILIDGEDAGKAVSAALAGAKRRTQAKLVFAGVPEREVALPRVQTKRLRPGELANVLYYEIEPFGALPIAEGVVGYAESPASDAVQAVYRVAQIPKARLDAALAAVAAAGCVAVAAETASGVPFQLQAAGRRFFLFAPRHLAVLALAAIAGAVAFDWWVLDARLKELEKDVEVRSGLQRRLDSEAARAGKLRREREEIERTRLETAAAQENAAALRHAASQFLSSVASALGDRAVVRAIESGSGGAISLRVSAVSISADEAARAMTRLDEILSPLGWSVHAEDVVRQASSAAFSCVCTFVGGKGGAASAAQQGEAASSRLNIFGEASR